MKRYFCDYRQKHGTALSDLCAQWILKPLGIHKLYVYNSLSFKELNVQMEKMLAECVLHYELEHGMSRNNREFCVIPKYSKYYSQSRKYCYYLWSRKGSSNRNCYTIVILPTCHVPSRRSFNNDHTLLCFILRHSL
jgi:hypothetical protein